MFLRVNKHNDPSRTALAVAAIILKRLRRVRVESYVELKEAVERKQKNVDSLIMPALNYLFLVGAIDYRPKTDSIEYIGI